jgi:NADPH2:quinone reductase
MKAAYYEQQGPAREVLQVAEVATPEPAQGEVRVRLHTSGVNPSDVKSRGSNAVRPMPGPRVIPHSDGAGVIDAVSGGVPASRVGERVWTWNAAFMRSQGTCAEYITLPAEQAVELPDNTDFAAGACLGIPALTALRGLTLDGPIDGQTILVSGGAGAVGHYAVQMAKLKGAATVIATVSSDEKAAIARTAGADHTINYRQDDVGAAVKEITGGAGADKIIEVDLAANAKLILDALAPFGGIHVYGSGGADIPIPAGAMMQRNMNLRLYLVYTLPAEVRTALTEDLTNMLASGQLSHAVAGHYPLDDIVAAHEAVESGKAIGNVIVDTA